MSSTLQQVADLADVSVSTASRALNRHPTITQETTARVQNAAQQLGYSPRRSHRRTDLGRLLAQSHIGLFCLGMDRSLVQIPAVASVISGAEAALSEAGATVQLVQIPELRNVPQAVYRKRFDGILVTGAMQGSLIANAKGRLLDWLRPTRTVWLLGRPAGCWGDAVTSNDYATGRLAAEYLVDRGHRRLAFLNPKPDHVLFRRREDGFLATAQRLGADVRVYAGSPPDMWTLPLHAPESVDAVQGLVDDLIATNPRPTAIFAAADSVAALVYRALAVRNMRVEEDISVVSGNNDVALIQSLYPQLTTYDIRAHDIGQMAVQQLAMRMSTTGDLPEATTMVEPLFVEGNSVRDLARY